MGSAPESGAAHPTTSGTRNRSSTKGLQRHAGRSVMVLVIPRLQPDIFAVPMQTRRPAASALSQYGAGSAHWPSASPPGSRDRANQPTRVTETTPDPEIPFTGTSNVDAAPSATSNDAITSSPRIARYAPDGSPATRIVFAVRVRVSGSRARTGAPRDPPSGRSARPRQSGRPQSRGGGATPSTSRGSRRRTPSRGTTTKALPASRQSPPKQNRPKTGSSAMTVRAQRSPPQKPRSISQE